MKVKPISQYNFLPETFINARGITGGIIEITEEEANGVRNRTYKFNESLTAAVKLTAPELQQLAEEDAARIKRMTKNREVSKLKRQLADMDYKTSKYADGDYTATEWDAIVKERKTIREEIRKLESQV